MLEYLPLLITLNVLTTVFYSSYTLQTSPFYKDELKSIFGVILVAFFGVLLIIFHAFNKDKFK
jgi:hypothetical protein